MYQIYVSPPSGPEVAIPIAFTRDDRLQLNQHCVSSGAQIRHLNGWCAGLLMMLACCLAFALPGYGYAANAAGTPMPAALSAPTCNSASMTGAGKDNCTVLLTAAAASGGQSVSLVANPAFTSTVTGLVNDDTVMTTYGTVATSVGAYPITAPISGPAVANYTPIVTPSVLTVAASPATTGINFGGGFATSQGQMILNGSTQLNGSGLQLTNGGTEEEGSAWYATPVNVQAFTTNFTFQLSNALADGITFAIQNQGTSALGIFGGGLGYQYIPTSVAVKFDLFNNRGEGTDSTGLYTNGAMPSVPAIDLSSTGIDLHSGDTMAVQLVYDGTNLVMTITDTLTLATYSTSFAIDIPATVGDTTAYVGFTGGTGGLSANQQILSWTYAPTSSSPVAPVPQLSISAGSVVFGNVAVNSTSTQSITLSSTGTGPVTINSATLTGAGFTVSGATFPVTLNPGQTVTLNVQFDPTTAGAATGQLTIQSNSSTNGTAVISLSGTGTTAPAPINFVQVASATPQSNTATVSVSYPASQTSGNLNVVVVGWNDTTATVTSVEDSAGNNYSLAIGPTSGTALRQSIYYAANIGGGGNTVTVTFSQPASFPDVRILEYQGVTALDVTAGASGSSASANSGSATTTSANELIFGANTVATTTGAAGSGFTSRIITSPNGDIVEDEVVTAAGSNSATATLTGTGPWVMQMVTFSAVSGPVPAVSSVSPNSGSTAGGTAVTINGTNFVTGAAVTFGGRAANNVVVVSGTQITATSPAGSAGAVTVTVTNSGGQSGSLASAFTYIAVPQLSISAGSVVFGNVAVNSTSTQSITLSSTGTGPVTINSATLTGAGFTVSGATFPVTLNPGQTVTLNVQFDPTTAGAATGQLTIQSNSSTNGTAVISLSGTGTTAPAALSALTCSSASMTGSGSDSCTVTLSAAAASGGLSVSLASSSAAVTVPATVTVPANATSAGFTASVSSVTSAQAVTLTASAGSVSKSFALQLNAAVPTLNISAASLTFGNVEVNTASTQAVTLSSTGSTAVTVSSVTVTGTGFTVSGGTFPVTLNPGQTVTLNVQFDPTTTGVATGQLTIQSNSSTNGTAVISLSGTGTPPEVDLSWDAPSGSTDPVAGYNIYRSTGGSSAYQLLNSSIDTQTTYVDSTVQSGLTYDYYVESVDSSGVESAPSNQVNVTIP